MNKSAAEVEAEVEAQRGKLDQTVEALKDMMTPEQLFDQASHALGGAGQRILAKLAEQAVEHPLPFALTGVGLAWLMTSSSKPSSDRAKTPDSFATGGYPAAPRASAGASKQNDHGLGVAVGDTLQHLKAKGSDMMSDAKESMAGARQKVSGAVSSTRDAVSDVADNLGDVKDKVTGQVSEYAQSAGRSVNDIFQREPLLLGALGLVVGMALGAALPSTEIEDHMVGRARDKALDKGKEMADDGLETATEAVHAAYGAIKSEVTDANGGMSVELTGTAARAGA